MDGAIPSRGPLSLRHTAHDSEVPLGRWRFWVRRDYDLWKRVEQRFGPLNGLEVKLRGCDIRAADLVELYQLALAKQAERLTDEAIGAAIARVGIAEACVPMSMLVMALGMGNEKCGEAFADPYPDDPDAPEAEPPPDPSAA